MANLKYGETHITNITQLCGSGQWSLPVPEVTDATQDCIICIDNDLDFNNEDFYYHNDHFFKIYLPNKNLTNSIIFDGQNHTLTNIYVLSQKSFFYVTEANNSTNFTIKNTTFEVVLNSFSRMMSEVTGDSHTTIFKNCIFNIKSISSLDYIFYRYYILNPDKYVFINCIFNIECNVLSNFNICYCGSSYSDSGAEVESCEFRIKIISANPNCAITLIYNAIRPRHNNDNFNNSLVFVNNYSNELVTIKLFHNTTYNDDSSVKSFTNNFISAFDGVTADVNKVDLDIDLEKDSSTKLSASFFIDTDCVSISSHLQKLADTTYPGLINLIPLTTTESKSPTEMAAKGYVFAQE